MALSSKNITKMFGDLPLFMGINHVRNLNGIESDGVVIGRHYDGIATFRNRAMRRVPQ